MPKPYIVVVAGGTGGHILPGICIGRELQRAGADVRFVSGRRDIERLVYDSHGERPWELSSSINPVNLAPVVKATCLAADFSQVFANFLVRRPFAVVAMGGSVCFPVLAVCRALGIPYFLHESNAIPGRVVRMFAGRAKRVFLGLGGLELPNVMITGTPAASAGEADVRDTVLCVGGSQGASRLNEMFVGALQEVPAALHPVLISGPGKRPQDPRGVEVREYVAEMAPLLARTALAVTRAGAGTLADLANFRVPAILVPYPHAMDNHQLANARIYAEAGAAVLIEERDLTTERLSAELRALLEDPRRLEEMRRALGQFSTEDSARLIAMEILAGNRVAASAPIPPAREVTHEHS